MTSLRWPRKLALSVLAAWHLAVVAACGAPLDLLGVGQASSPQPTPTAHVAASAAAWAVAPGDAEGARTRVAEQLQPTTMNAGFLVGSMAGDSIAVFVANFVTNALAAAFGAPGFLLGRMISFPLIMSVTRVAARYGSQAEQGDTSLREAVAATLLEIRPMEELCALVGSAVGGAVGTAALAAVPVPGAGLMVGGVLGYVVGRRLGAWLVSSGTTARVDRELSAGLGLAAEAVLRRDDESPATSR